MTGSRAAAEWLAEGRRWFDARVHDAALECGLMALTQSPDDPQILFLLGSVSADLNRLAAARGYFEQIVTANPTWNDGAARVALTRVQAQMSEAEDAWFNCQKWPSAETFFSSAIWLRRIGRLEDALSSLDAAASSGWDREDVLIESGEVHMERGAFQAALSCFEAALEIDAARADIWYGQAAALRHLGRHREALSAVERSLQLTPTAAGRWLRGEILDAHS